MIRYESGEPLTCGQIRDLDVLAIEHLGIPSIILMETAARAISDLAYLSLLNPRTARVCILCGPGNNGGDGLAIARHLRNVGVAVSVVLAQPRTRMTGDAEINLRIFERIGGRPLCAALDADTSEIRKSVTTSTLLIDALLGTGSSGPPRGSIAELIRLTSTNESAARIAVDVPSGLDADSGMVHDPCFRADATVTFVALKPGFSKSAAQAMLGQVTVADIGLPHALIPGRKPAAD